MNEMLIVMPKLLNLKCPHYTETNDAYTSYTMF